MGGVRPWDEGPKSRRGGRLHEAEQPSHVELSLGRPEEVLGGDLVEAVETGPRSRAARRRRRELHAAGHAAGEGSSLRSPRTLEVSELLPPELEALLLDGEPDVVAADRHEDAEDWHGPGRRWRLRGAED